jgi:hypothetical protein
MKTRLLSAIMVFCLFVSAQAQEITVDEILNNYYENTGGYDAWSKVTGMKMQAKVNQSGMEIPLEIVALKDGKQYTKITFQGMSLMQGVFDGSTLWSTNFQTMKAEKSDQESTDNQILNSNDFPESFFDYKKKNYTAEYLGKETIEGTETHKVKLTKEPITVDGEKKDDVTFYFFDIENFVPIFQEKEVFSGPQKGAISIIAMSDYQEVDGLFFPFSLSQGVKGVGSQAIVIESIELNPTVDTTVFVLPAGN